MRNLLRNIGGGVAVAIAWLGVLSTLAYALTIPPTFAPRLFPWQMVHFERHVLQVNPAVTNFVGGFTADNLTSCVWVSSTCSVKVGALPYNAFILRGNWFQGAVCNPGAGTCTMSLGTASGGAQIVSAQDIKTVAAGAPALTIVTAGAGAQVTGNGTAQSGADLGFDLYATITWTTAAPTTGTIVFDLEYLSPDGGCTPLVPALGQTAPTC